MQQSSLFKPKIEPAAKVESLLAEQDGGCTYNSFRFLCGLGVFSSGEQTGRGTSTHALYTSVDNQGTMDFR